MSSTKLKESAPIYSFGYPLSEFGNYKKEDHTASGKRWFCPRTTSTIISSVHQGYPAMNSLDIEVYVLDKALNEGNSGGSIVATETGNVHTICTGSHPLMIRQKFTDGNKKQVQVEIPSLYGFATSLSNPNIMKALDDLEIPHN